MEEITHILEYEDGTLKGMPGTFNASTYSQDEGVVAIHEVCKTHRKESVFRVASIQKRARRHRLPSGENKYLHEMTPEERKQLNEGLAKARDARRRKMPGLQN